jgi:hypothetical protein
MDKERERDRQTDTDTDRDRGERISCEEKRRKKAEKGLKEAGKKSLGGNPKKGEDLQFLNRGMCPLTV